MQCCRWTYFVDVFNFEYDLIEYRHKGVGGNDGEEHKGDEHPIRPVAVAPEIL